MTDPPHPAPRAPDTRAAGRRQAAQARAAAAAHWAERHADSLRQRSLVVAAAFEAGEVDRRRAGSLLAGGIAFRVFLWFLPAALFASGVAAILHLSGSASPQQIAGKLGLGASVARTVRQATVHSDQGAVWLIVVGAVLTLYAATSLVRALRITHVLAWEEQLGRRPHLLRDGAIFSATLIGAVTVETGISYLRADHEGLSLVLIPAAFAIAGVAWLGVSIMLPHGTAPVRALVPGALLFATGQVLLHVATIYYFAPKLTKAPALYGSLGAAATVLAWLFLLSRIIVASAFLNAALWRKASVDTAQTAATVSTS